MKRNHMIERLRAATSSGRRQDVLVIGGGATGLGIAIDAASRGYQTTLLERADFAQGTSSRSTKLVHGGVRYLQQGNVSLVLEALEERGLLRQNAPHLVHDLPFVVPNYEWWEAPFYGVGLKVYDLLAGRHGFGKSKNLSLEETVAALPTIEKDGLRGGTLYYDGQFDDARLALDMAQTAVSLGATVCNYVEVTALVHDARGEVSGVTARCKESGEDFELGAAVVINATGPFVDGVRRLDDSEAPPMVRPSQGVHIVLPHDFLGGDAAIMVPHTDDGRVLFAIPWYDVVVVGTTDTPIPEVPVEPRPFDAEVDFLIEHAARYLTRDPERSDVRSVFAGVRPLVGDPDNPDSKSISRDHTIHISSSGLLTVAGGKWTTYRKMAEDAVDQAALLGGLASRPCRTHTLELHGYHRDAGSFGELACYGADAPSVRDLLRVLDPDGSRGLDQRLHRDLRPLAGEVVWAVEEEMARTVEDFLSRRTRSLLFDARASLEIAPRVAELMADALSRDASWQKEQVEAFHQLAAGYILD